MIYQAILTDTEHARYEEVRAVGISVEWSFWR